MLITKYIENLLYTESCVIVPDLGAFVTSNRAASYDEKKGLLLPPKKEVVFNAQLKHNDGVLINAITNHLGITSSEASEQIESEVSDIKNRLRNGMPIDFEGIGTLAWDNATSNYVFSADKQQNFDPESYGYGAVRVTPVKHGESLKLSQSKALKAAGIAAAIIIGLFVAPIVQDTKIADNNYYASLFNLGSNDKSTEIIDPETAPETMTIPAETTETTDAANVNLESDAEPATAVEATTPKAITEVATTPKGYYIIIGSFATDREATQVMSRFQKRGITDIEKLVDPQSKRVRLSVARFDTKNEALSRNRAVRKVKGMEKSWVLSVE